MKWLSLAFSVGFVLVAMPVLAQDATEKTTPPGTTITSTGAVTPTPEMWFYEQYAQQYRDPKAAVRQKAEERTAQRQARMAARQWFGFSNLRPTAGADYVHGDYSPRWTSRDNLHPFRWSSQGVTAVVVRPVVQSRALY
jgi:hypothetical protein